MLKSPANADCNPVEVLSREEVLEEALEDIRELLRSRKWNLEQVIDMIDNALEL